MSDEQISTSAKLNAERLMSGRRITDDEMRVIIAGLMLSVDKLANAFDDMRGALWSEEKMRQMIADEVEKHCAENKRACAVSEGNEETRKGVIAWLGRLIRSIVGL